MALLGGCGGGPRLIREPESLDALDVPCCDCFCCFFNVKCLVSSALKSLTPFTALFGTAALGDAECDGDSLGGEVRLVVAEDKKKSIR